MAGREVGRTSPSATATPQKEHGFEPLVGGLCLEADASEACGGGLRRRSSGAAPHQRAVRRAVLASAAVVALLGGCLAAVALLRRARGSQLPVRGHHPGDAEVFELKQALGMSIGTATFRDLSDQARAADQAAREEVVALHAEVAHLQIMLPEQEREREIADLKADVLRLKAVLLATDLKQNAAAAAARADEQEEEEDRGAGQGHRKVLVAPPIPAPQHEQQSPEVVIAPPLPAPQHEQQAPEVVAAWPSKRVAAGAAGWYDGGEDRSCDAGCAAQGLRCSEEAFAAENEAVASSDKVVDLIESVGGVTTAGACDDQFGASPDVPLWSENSCFHSKANRSVSSFDCSTVPMPLGEGKHRLCYCEEDAAKTALIERKYAGQCAIANQNCSASRCCQEEGQVCFEKAPGWATCAYDCKRGIHQRDPLKYRYPWTCQILSPVTAPKYPTLYCFLAMRSSGLELHVVQHQVKHRVGIFSCNDYEVFSDTVLSLGSGIATKKLAHFGAKSGVKGALTATWVNTDGFTEAWEAVMGNRRSWSHDWMVKVDPDTVFFPTRLQVKLRHLSREVEEKGGERGAYLRNCNTDALQLYGSMEVISSKALQRFRRRGTACDSKDNQRMGEDMWIQRCLDKLRVAGVDAWDILDDRYCPATNTHPQPCRFGAAAFHPYKAQEQWSNCWVRARLPRSGSSEVVVKK